MVAYYNRRVFFCAGVVVQQGRRSQETNVPAKPLPPSPCRTQEGRLRITPPSRNEGGKGGVRREHGRGGGRKELNRARVPGIISRVSPPFETATALGQREGFVVQDRVGKCFRVAACFSLSLLGYEWFGARKRNAPHRCACALRTWTKRRLAPPGYRKTLRGSA